MIKVPYTVTADMSKYEGEAFNAAPSKYYLAQKKLELQNLGNKTGFTLLDGYQFVEDLSRFCGTKLTNDIRQIALQLEEDVAVLYQGRLVSMCFCFPSGFDPYEKLGKSFMELHAPVADNEKLQRAASKVTEVISKPGVKYRRNVWTLTTSPELSRHPIYKPYEPEVTTKDSLYFRKETQTTVGYGDGKTTFFFVKVEVVPFMSLDHKIQKEAIQSINTMSDAVLTYKGLHAIKSVLNEAHIVSI